MALISDSLKNAQQQIIKLQKHTTKVGLQIFFKKTQLMTNVSDASQYINKNNKTISKTDCFKFLGEWISKTPQKKLAIQTRIQRMKRAFRITRNTYNKKSLS